MQAAEAAGEPVSESEAAALFDPLKRYRHVALGVSGGSDSTALMWLAARWAARTSSAPRLTVLTIDHGLRAESAAEARAVGEVARRLGLCPVVLEWRGDKPKSGLQTKAREVRYRLLSRWCLDNGAEALLTAHTADDQAETFLMRLARGSGLDGLAGIRPQLCEPLPILRPLLGVSRARLRATLRAAGESWIEDPSNEDVRYERVRWRRALAAIEAAGVPAAMIARSAARLERSRQALERAVAGLEAKAVRYETDSATLALAAIEKEPLEFIVRLLHRLVARYGGKTEPPRLSAVERLAQWAVAGAGGGRTLAGCRVARRRDVLQFTRERPRRALTGEPSTRQDGSDGRQ